MFAACHAYCTHYRWLFDSQLVGGGGGGRGLVINVMKANKHVNILIYSRSICCIYICEKFAFLRHIRMHSVQ